MSWLLRLGALCALLGAVACTGNPKPLPPNNPNDGQMQIPDASVSQDANVEQDAFVPGPDAATDAGATDGGPDEDGGQDAGHSDAQTRDGGDRDGSGPPYLDAGPFVPDGTVRR